jgi:hypothetical protein
VAPRSTGIGGEAQRPAEHMGAGPRGRGDPN